MLTLAAPLDVSHRQHPSAVGAQAARGSRLPRWLAAAAIAALPVLTPQGPGNTAPVDVLVLGAILLTLLWAGAAKKLLRFPYIAGVGTLVAAGCIGALFGNYPHEGIVAVAIDMFLLAWATAVANVGRDPAAARFLVRAWCLSGSAWAVGFLALVGKTTATSGTAVADSSRLGFTLGEQNGAGFYFAATILIVLAGRVPRRLPWRALVLCCLAVDLLLTGSLAGIAGLLVGLALALIVRAGRRRGTAYALVLAVAVVSAGGAGYEALQSTGALERAQSSADSLVRLSIGREQQSIWERQTLTQETLHLWYTSSPLGSGPASTKSILKQQMASYPKEAHDDWTAALVERGALGLGGLLLLVTELAWRASVVGGRRRAGPPGWASVLPAPEFLVGALGTLAVFSFTHQQLHDRTVWTLFGFLAALSLWRDRSPRPSGLPAGDQPDRRDQ